MKINYLKAAPDTTKLTDFADRHNLQMTIIEDLETKVEYLRFKAFLNNVEVSNSGIVEIPTGYGSTIEYAIQNYCLKIEGWPLRIFDGTRVYAPKKLTYKTGD